MSELSAAVSGGTIASNPSLPYSAAASEGSIGGRVPLPMSAGAPSHLTAGDTAAAAASSVRDRFGMLGLLNLLRTSNHDLTVGIDLTSLGLNLGSQDNLFSTFSSPWSARPRPSSDTRLSESYRMLPQPVKPGLFQKFALETLFYIFYSMPRDHMQTLAAHELYQRKWWFHKQLGQWITRAPKMEPTIKANGYEKGTYVVFDVRRWEKVRKENFTLSYDQIEQVPKL